MPCGVKYSTGIKRYRPCHGPPMKCTVMVSLTLTLLSGRTSTCATNFSIFSSLEYAGNTHLIRIKLAISHRTVLAERRCRSVEANLGSFALGRGGDFKKFPGLEAQHAGKNIGRELLDLGVQVAHH